MENQLEQALINIENRALPEARGGVKKIWQSGPEDAEEREHDCRRWQEQNSGWEYKVNSSHKQETEFLSELISPLVSY